MSRPQSIVVASHNPGKVSEIAALLAPLGIAAESAGALGLPEPEETGSTFAENAAVKALAASTATGRTALADDSGLVVKALGGAPGIYSARWAGPERNFSHAMRRIEQELDTLGDVDRNAHFVCALALAAPGEETAIFEAKVQGHLRFPPRGSRGFGYDPIFVAEGMEQSFGEIDPALKHAISHRAQAFAKLKNWLATH